MKSRETGEWAKFGAMGMGVDARASVTIVIWAVHAMWTTFYIMCMIFSVLVVLQMFGLSPRDAWRKLRRGLAGDHVHIRRFNRIIS